MGRIALESFDAEAPVATGPDPEYQAGFVAGEAAGLAAAAAQETALQAELVQTIADLNFTYSEARQDIMQALRPLFDQVITTLLPHCIDAGFAPEIAALIHGQIDDAMAGRLTLAVHPSQLNAVSDALQSLAAPPDLAPDDTLTPHAAWISGGAATRHLDLDTLMAEVSGVLAAIHTAAERTPTHG